MHEEDHQERSPESGDEFEPRVLIEKIGQLHDEALRFAVATFRDKLKKTPDVGMAETLAEEAVEMAVENAVKEVSEKRFVWQGEPQFRGWFYQILKRRMADVTRDLAKRAEEIQEWEAIAGKRDGPSRIARINEKRQIVQDILAADNLTHRQKQILYWSYYEDRPLSWIAAQLGTNASNVSARRRHALDLFKESLPTARRSAYFSSR